MLISTEVSIKWNARNKNHYVSLGYKFTKMKDSFVVKTEHLTPGSIAVIILRCDYCGKEYTSTWDRYMHIKRHTKIDKDCCKECQEIKCAEVIGSTYGGYKGLFEKTNKQRRETNIEKYGAENPFASDEIKKRIVETNIRKYGVPYSQQCEIVRSKVKSTCLERYGVENYIEVFKGQFIKENSPVWKGGAEHSRVERATYEYSQWRTSVFARDKYRCQCCGNKNGYGHTVELHAHHINNWKDYPKQRYDVDNGITVCSKCHMLFHSIYGKRNNDISQLQEFLQLNSKSDKKIC